MSRPDYEPPNAAEQLTALTDAIARTVHYAHAVSAGFDCPFSELPDDRKAYLFRLAQMVIGLADTDKAEDARSLLTVAFAHAVDGILRDIHHQWEDHSSAEFLQQRFDQVEARMRVAFVHTVDAGLRPVLARLGVTGGR